MIWSIQKRIIKLPGGMKFLLAIFAIYAVTLTFNQALVYVAVVETMQMFSRIIPMLAIVFVIMIVVNLYLESGKISKYLGENSGLKGWFNAIIAGILVSGPPYILYPLLRDFKRKGVKDSLIAVFLYNRNVKIPFIPIMIVYFGLTYTIVLSFFIIVFSVLNGMLIGHIMKKSN